MSFSIPRFKEKISEVDTPHLIVIVSITETGVPALNLKFSNRNLTHISLDRYVCKKQTSFVGKKN